MRLVATCKGAYNAVWRRIATRMSLFCARLQSFLSAWVARRREHVELLAEHVRLKREIELLRMELRIKESFLSRVRPEDEDPEDSESQ